MNYFAYGSNMLVERLRRRVPSARVLTVASLPGHVLRFHKRSTDGSGKCNAFESSNPEHEVYGVVFEIDEAEKDRLDKAEAVGRGYSEVTVQLSSPNGNLTAFTYMADPNFIDDSLHPYTWYKEFVVQGAKQNSLPDAYILQLEAVKAQEDPNSERATEQREVLEGLSNKSTWH